MVHSGNDDNAGFTAIGHFVMDGFDLLVRTEESCKLFCGNCNIMINKYKFYNILLLSKKTKKFFKKKATILIL